MHINNTIGREYSHSCCHLVHYMAISLNNVNFGHGAASQEVIIYMYKRMSEESNAFMYKDSARYCLRLQLKEEVRVLAQVGSTHQEGRKHGTKMYAS